MNYRVISFEEANRHWWDDMLDRVKEYMSEHPDCTDGEEAMARIYEERRRYGARIREEARHDHHA